MRPLVVAALALGGCIKAPEIVLVDRATALEQQAAGSYPDIERELTETALAPRPAALTPEQLEALGIAPPAIVDDAERTDADRVDALLQQHCIGEAHDGLLVETHAACKGAADRAQANALIEKVNDARQQLWRWMRSRTPKTPLADVRKSWTTTHARAVVCGGWRQRDDGNWEEKTC